MLAVLLSWWHAIGAFLEWLVHASVEFIKLHQEWSFPVIFIVSFGESFVGFSLLFPGTTIMILAGTLVAWPLNPHGVLSIWPVLSGAILGAVIGDTISYMLGQRFGHLLEKHWFFIRHPELLARGYGFFERFGTISVFVGRFFGPVRAVIPLVAGIMGMPTRRFWIANIASAFIWAPALLLVGSGIHTVATLVMAKHERLLISAVVVVALTAAIWALEKYGLLDRFKPAKTER
jgi:membrane protein DedA with SNARE-associated domain